MSPYDGTDLLDADGDDGDLSVRACIYNKDSAGFKHLEIRYAALHIAIPALLFIPDDLASSGMDALDRAAFQHNTIARHMEAMIIKHIEDDMRRLAASKRIPIRAVAEQFQPISDTRGLDRRESNLAVTRTRERMNE